MNTATRIVKSAFYLSIICLIYFSLLAYWSYYPPKASGTLQFFGEMLTIPLLLGLIFSFFYSLIQLIRKQNSQTNLVTFGLSLGTITMLIVVTVLQAQG